MMVFLQILRGSHTLVPLKRIGKVIGVIKADRLINLGKGRGRSQQRFGFFDTANVQILLKRAVEALFKQTAEMSDTVSAILRNLLSGKLSTDISVDELRNLQHEAVLIRYGIGLLGLQSLSYDNGVEHYEIAEYGNGPARRMSHSKLYRMIDALTKLSACGMLAGDEIGEPKRSQLIKEKLVFLLGRKQVGWLKDHTGARKVCRTIHQVDAVIFKGIDDKNIVFLNVIFLIVDDHPRRAAIDAKDLNSLMKMIVGKHVLRIQLSAHRVQHMLLLGADDIVDRYQSSSLLLGIVIL